VIIAAAEEMWMVGASIPSLSIRQANTLRLSRERLARRSLEHQPLVGGTGC
jgi:hypothetical protein